MKEPTLHTHRSLLHRMTVESKCLSTRRIATENLAQQPDLLSSGKIIMGHKIIFVFLDHSERDIGGSEQLSDCIILGSEQLSDCMILGMGNGFDQ